MHRQAGTTYRNEKVVIMKEAPHITFAAGPSNHIWGSVDTGIALICFNLACEAFNVGCCFAAYSAKSAEFGAIRRFLNVRLFGALCVLTKRHSIH